MDTRCPACGMWHWCRWPGPPFPTGCDADTAGRRPEVTWAWYPCRPKIRAAADADGRWQWRVHCARHCAYATFVTADDALSWVIAHQYQQLS